jgi:hypothetical protein
MRQLLLALLAVLPAWTCSCFSSYTPCSVLDGRTIIFVAEVIVDSGEGLGEGPAKVRIVEPLQNVPTGLKEATIETRARTSCYRRLRAGERYVIISDGPKYSVSGCNPTFRLTGNEHILDAMRDQLQGGGPRLLGSVLSSTGPYTHHGGVPGAIVELIKGDSRHTATTDGEGRYVIPGLEAGRYRISVRGDRYVPDEEYNNRWSGRMAVNPKTNRIEPVNDVPGEIEIRPGSCEIRNLAMWPAGSIRGTVRGADGRPVPGVPVQAFQFNRRGEPESSPLQTATTGSDGGYRIEPLPAGQYVIGINARRYDDDNAYPPALYDGGRSVFLAESGSVDAIDLTVGAPRTPARLRVKVFGPDAKPIEGASVRLDTPEGAQRWFSRDKTDGTGELVAPVYVGQRYTVRASHYMTRNNTIRDLEGTVSVDVTSPEAAVIVVLQERKGGSPSLER